VLQRQLGAQKPRFDPSDRALLAALPRRLPKDVLRGLRLLVRPDTILRWHRDLITRRHAAASKPKRPGRPTRPGSSTSRSTAYGKAAPGEVASKRGALEWGGNLDSNMAADRPQR
jgi:hypothetical protein